MQTHHLLPIVLAVLVSGCGMTSATAVTGSGKSASETRSVSGFNTVTLEGSGQLVLEQAGTESLTITADDNLLPYLTSDVSNGHLTLGTKRGTEINSSTPVRYKLGVKKLNELTLAGSGSISGSAITSDSLKVTVGGSGDVTVSGAADRLEIMVAGSGNFQGEKLQSKDVSIQIMGSGNAVLAASEKLDTMIMGSGSVEYTGNPAVTTKSLGSGTVKKKP
jgi:hypothetical protein